MVPLVKRRSWVSESHSDKISLEWFAWSDTELPFMMTGARRPRIRSPRVEDKSRYDVGGAALRTAPQRGWSAEGIVELDACRCLLNYSIGNETLLLGVATALMASVAYCTSVRSNNLNHDTTMLRWTLIFLVIAVIAGLLGFTGVAGTASEIAKILFFVFLVLLIISALISAFKGRPPV
jgi:uncharacterized membrane protein YtjA (UPF0391 family)